MLLIGRSASAQCQAMFQAFVQSSPPPIVVFTDSSMSANPIVSWDWDFGDGQTGTGQFTQHAYAAFGTYTACLTISDGMGCTDSMCQTITLVMPTPTVSAFLYVDSMSMYFCTAPAQTMFDYFINTSGYLSTDSVHIEINYGDGVDTSYYLTLANPFLQGTLSHVYLNAGTYTPQIIVTGPDLTADTSLSMTIEVYSTCGPITGSVFVDNNNNCINDVGDQPAPNVNVQLYDGANFVAWTMTDINGIYSFNVPAGPTYTIMINNGGYNSHYVTTCPTGGTISVSSLPSSGNDFGLSCPAGFDLTGHVTGWGFRPGLTASVCINAYNEYCTTPTGQIELIFDPLLTPLPDSTGSGYTVNGQTVTLPIGAPFWDWNFCVPVLVSLSANIGDTVCIEMNITPTVGDSTPSNNSQTFCFPVRNSWDPNDKYAVPEGVDAQGYIRPNTDLTYTIRFQNTGNDVAFNIFILDTLDADLDAASIEVLGASHPMTWSLLTGNIMRFNFDNINLPDSNANEPASHGYVSYRIKQVPNISHLAEIHNTAGIYFDFNPPVITNTTLHTIDQFLSVPLTLVSNSIDLWPNPAGNYCEISSGLTPIKSIHIFDALGKVVMQKEPATNYYGLNTSSLPIGIYSIRITLTDESEMISRLVIAR